MVEIPILGHGLFPWQSAVVESVHVDDLLRFHHNGWLGLVFEPALALEGDSQLLHHGTAEGPLQRTKETAELNAFHSTTLFQSYEKDNTPSFVNPPPSFKITSTGVKVKCTAMQVRNTELINSLCLQLYTSVH